MSIVCQITLVLSNTLKPYKVGYINFVSAVSLFSQIITGISSLAIALTRDYLADRESTKPLSILIYAARLFMFIIPSIICLFVFVMMKINKNVKHMNIKKLVAVMMKINKNFRNWTRVIIEYLTNIPTK